MDAAVSPVERSCFAVVGILLMAAVVSALQLRTALGNIEHRTQIGKALLDSSVATARIKVTAQERPEATARAEAAIEKAAQADREKLDLTAPQETKIVRARKARNAFRSYPVRDRFGGGGW